MAWRISAWRWARGLMSVIGWLFSLVEAGDHFYDYNVDWGSSWFGIGKLQVLVGRVE
jgi:hypothetical protein